MAKKSVLKKIKNIAIQIITVIIIVLVLRPFYTILFSLVPFSISGYIIIQAVALICFLLQLVIHEFGHLVAGKMSGYKFLWLSIFNITFVKKNKKLMRMSVDGDGSFGNCLMIPPEMKNGKYPFVFFFLGGSLMNFLVSAISLALFFIFFPTYWVFLVFAIFGIFFGIMNIVPINVGNDGHSILKLYKSDTERRNFWHLCRYNEDMLIKEMRPRDISAEQLTLLGSKSQGGENQKDDLDATAEFLRLSWLIDRHEFEKAKIFVENLLTTSDDKIALKNEFIRVLLFLELIGECRKEEIERLYTKELKKYIKTEAPTILGQVSQYAYAKLFLQDNTQVVKALKEFNKIALLYPFVGEIVGGRELIEIVDKLAMERKK